MTTRTTSSILELPRNVAGRAVKLPREIAGGVTARGREVWLAGLGALAAAEEEGTQLFSTLVKQGERLVERGEAVEARGRTRVADTLDGVRGDLAVRQKDVAQVVGAVEYEVGEAFTGALRRLGVPTRAEVRELSDRVDVLTRRVGALVDALQADGPGRTTRAEFTVAARAENWAVGMAGEAEPRALFGTKKEALEAARTLAAAHAPSRLVVHGRDGAVQDTLAFEA